MFEAHLNEREKGVDWSLIAAVIGLMIIGAAFIYSASFAKEATQTMVWYRKLYMKQVICYALGIIGASALCFLDYRSVSRWALVAYWASILMLLTVPFLGVSILGAKRWINLPFGFQLQPSEFAKIAFIFAIANYLSRP